MATVVASAMRTRTAVPLDPFPRKREPRAARANLLVTTSPPDVDTQVDVSAAFTDPG